MFPYSRPFVAEIKAFDENLRRGFLMASDKIYDIMVELLEN